MKKPTLEFYDYLQSTYDFFNQRLFESKLPHVMLTITRNKKTYGFFRPDGFADVDGTLYHELALNPEYFVASSPLEFYQTVVHEQAHIYQHIYGKPPRRCYHNKEWADLMQSIGLMPSDTGKVGGKRTGQHMMDYPIENGKFIKACYDFFRAGYSLSMVDTQYNNSITLQRINDAIKELISSDNETDVQSLNEIVSDITEELNTPFNEIFALDEALNPKPNNSSSLKTTYICGGCQAKVWGKSGLRIICDWCNEPFYADK